MTMPLQSDTTTCFAQLPSRHVCASLPIRQPWQLQASLPPKRQSASPSHAAALSPEEFAFEQPPLHHIELSFAELTGEESRSTADL